MIKRILLALLTFVPLCAAAADDAGVEVRASHILVTSLEHAETLYERLRRYQGEGADIAVAFGTLAKLHSIDPATKNREGDLGYFGASDQGKPLWDAASSLPVGVVSRPVRTQSGWHLILATDKRTRLPEPGKLDSLPNFVAQRLGADWIEISRTSSSVMFLNRKSPREESGGNISAWFFESYFQTRPSDAGMPANSERSLHWVDCKREALGEKERTKFTGWAGDGEVVESTSNQDRATIDGMRRVAPGTIGAKMVGVVCSADRKKNK